MSELEGLLVLFLAAVALAAAARRAGAPYPVFLALGGALLAFVPGDPGLRCRRSWRLRSSLRRCFSTRPTTLRRGT
jgi:hypothetical protein